ncbi:MAG: CcmD family protein [Chitinophagaceae bacterium]
MKKIISFFTLFFVFLVAMGQGGTEEVQMADALRSNGKIYVVVAVVVIILIGLFIYLFRLDRKITRLEKNANVKI